MGRKVLPGADPFARGTAGGSLANRRGAAHSRVLCFSRRSRPSQLFDRRNGPEPSRARLLLARRSEPLTARTVLASGATRRAALAGKTPFPLVSSEHFLKPLSEPPFRVWPGCEPGRAAWICPPPTDRQPVSVPPPALPGCGSPLHFPLVHGCQLRVPPRRYFRRLDQHRLQMRVALFRDRPALLFVGR